MYRIPCACQPIWAKSWSRRMCRIPRTCQPKRAVGGLEELDLGEELEQANVQNLSHLSAETSCRDLAEISGTQIGSSLKLT